MNRRNVWVPCFYMIFVQLAGLCFAAQPQITLLEPPGMRRGHESEIVISGARLSDAQEVLFYSPGFEVKQLQSENAGAVKVKVAVSPECRLGIHALRVRAATGVSNLWTFGVGALPEVNEQEPNSDFANPQAVELDTTVHGVITREDVDYFAVNAKAGERITAELEGVRLGITFFDPYLAILDEKRFELSRCDDAALLQQDAVCSLIAPADGRYVVQVRHSAFEGDDRSKYRLHIGRFPRPTAVLPAGAKPGETLQVTWLGDAAGPATREVTWPGLEQLPKFANMRAPLFGVDDRGTASSPNWVRVSDLANVLEVEPNQDMKNATPFTAPAALNGVMGEAGDLDRFKFTAKKGQRFDVRVFARQILRSPLDPVLRIRDATGKSLASNDDSGGPDSYLAFASPADGDYVIELSDHLKAGGVDFVYRVEVANVQPGLVTTLPERQRYVSTTLAVPRGNRMALMVGVQRSNFAGDVNYQFDALPTGLTASTVPVPANRGDMPVLFTAAADAALAGSLADVVARPADENVKIQGHLQQRTMLIRGQNNRDVWGHDADRMAAVVTQEAPFSIEIVQPKAPLVRNGSMQLKVVASRQDGFTAPIAVRMLYNPTGVASSASLSIPEGKNEAVIPLTANASAEIRKWPIVVIGRGPGSGGGSVEVASQMAELDVADRYFDLVFGKTAVEQGKPAELLVKITHKRPFEGPAQVQVLGLPAGATCEALQFTKESEQISLPIATAKDARVGRHGTVLCRVVVTENGEPVTHTLGTGELRIDKPLPPKTAVAAKPAAKPAEAAPAKPTPTPTPKPLSRLEQLRQAKETTAGG